MAFSLTGDDLKDKEVFATKLVGLATIVYNRHYYASIREKEDLLSVGVLKALTMVESGNWDGKRSIVTFLYTGMRNEMHNYLYRVNKDVCFDDFYEEHEDDGVEDVYFVSDYLSIEPNVVQEVCKNFKGYGDICGLVVDRLRSMGFEVSYQGEMQEIKGYEKNFIEDFIERLVGAVIWKSRECYL